MSQICRKTSELIGDFYGYEAYKVANLMSL